MGKYTYSPDIMAKINKVCNDLCFQIIADFPDLIINEIEPVFNNIVNFIKDNHSELGTIQYLIELDLKDISISHLISPQIIIDEISHGSSFIKINKNLHILEIKSFDKNLAISSISKYSRKSDNIQIFVLNGVNLMVFSKGIIIEEINVTSPTSAAVIINKYSHPAENYRLSLKDFYKLKVRNNLIKPWNDKPKRILKGGQTEKYFQTALVQWLKDNLIAKKINFSTRKISGEETDIEIIEHGGDTYMIELKWMGKNKGGSNYGIDKVEVAFDQVQNYIDGEPEIINVSLVVYDGRDQSEFDKLIFIEEEKGNWKEIKECNSKILPLKATGFIFYLVNLSASKRPAV